MTVAAQVDYVLTEALGGVTGTSRYQSEIFARLAPRVDARAIYSSSLSWPGMRRTARYLTYPWQVAARREKGSILHLTSQTIAHLTRGAKSPVVVTCLDIIPLLDESTSSFYRKLFSLSLSGIRRADRVVAISNYTKADVATHLRYPEDQIDVVYPGVDVDLFCPGDKDAARTLFGLPQDKRIVLYVGSEHPRKNFPALVRALKDLPSDVMLVKAGRPDWPGAREGNTSLATRCGVLDRVRFMDFVAPSLLPELYRAADVFAFPSLYEGFGIPPLEAMACGIPVVVSDASSLPEVVGEAGVKIPPRHIKRWAEALDQILIDPVECRRLSVEGRRRALGFTWAHSADQLAGVYESLSLQQART